MKKIKYFLLINTFFIISCHYTDDKLIIKNNSQNEICYETLIKSKKKYDQISGGGKIKINGSESPSVRSSISKEINENSSNKILYIVYYNFEDLQFVNNNLNTIVNNKKFKVDKYSLKELDSMNWVVSYPRNAKIK